MEILNACDAKRVLYNDFIQGFGQEFDEFDVRGLTSFVSNLRKPGLNQRDILAAVNARNLELLSDEEKDLGERQLAFKQSIRELITANLELDSHDDESLKKLMTDEVSTRLGKKSIS